MKQLTSNQVEKLNTLLNSKYCADMAVRDLDAKYPTFESIPNYDTHLVEQDKLIRAQLIADGNLAKLGLNPNHF